MVDDVSGKATIQLYVKYNTTTLYRSNCEYNQSLKSFVTISLIFQSLLNILLIESHILIPLFFVIMMTKGLDMRTILGSAWNCCRCPRRRRFSCLKPKFKRLEKNARYFTRQNYLRTSSS